MTCASCTSNKSLHGFELHDELTFHDDVHPIAAFQLEALVFDGHRDLPLEAQAAQRQLARETLLASRLQEARAQHAMDLDARADHRLRPIPEPSRLLAFLFHSPIAAATLVAAALVSCSEVEPVGEQVEVVVAQELTTRWALLSHRISALELTYDPAGSAVVAQNDGGGFGAVDTPEAVYGWASWRSRSLVAAHGSTTIAIPPGSEVDGEPFSAVGRVEIDRGPLRDATSLVAYLRGYRIDADEYESPPDFETDPDLPYDPAEGYTSLGIGIALGDPVASDDDTVGVDVRVRNGLGTSDRADMNAAIPLATTWMRVDVVVVGATSARAATSRGSVDYFLSVADWGRQTEQPRADDELQGFEVAGEPGLGTAMLGLTAFEVWVNVPDRHDPDCVVDQDDLNSWDEPVSGPGRYLREIGARLYDWTYDAGGGVARGKLDLYVSTASEYDEIGNLCAGLRGEVGMFQIDGDAAKDAGALSSSFASGELATEPLVVDAP